MKHLYVMLREDGLVKVGISDTDNLLYLNSVIGDGFHNVAEILVDPMSESRRGERLRQEVTCFKQGVGLVSIPDMMPDCWFRLMRNADRLLAS